MSGFRHVNVRALTAPNATTVQLTIASSSQIKDVTARMLTRKDFALFGTSIAEIEVYYEKGGELVGPIPDTTALRQLHWSSVLLYTTKGGDVGPEAPPPIVLASDGRPPRSQPPPCPQPSARALSPDDSPILPGRRGDMPSAGDSTCAAKVAGVMQVLDVVLQELYDIKESQRLMREQQAMILALLDKDTRAPQGRHEDDIVLSPSYDEPSPPPQHQPDSAEVENGSGGRPHPSQDGAEPQGLNWVAPRGNNKRSPAGARRKSWR